jgi:hypothetical protein
MPELPEASEYAAELGGIIERYNAAIRDVAGSDAKVEGSSELGHAKRALASVQSELRQLKQRVIQTEKQIHADTANAMGEASGKSTCFCKSLVGGRPRPEPALTKSAPSRDKRQRCSSRTEMSNWRLMRAFGKWARRAPAYNKS